MRRSISCLLGVCGVVAGCAANPPPPPESPVVEVPQAKAESGGDEAPDATGGQKHAATQPPERAPAPKRSPPRADKPPAPRAPEPRAVVARRVLAELHQAQLDDEREQAERRKKLEKALSNSRILGQLQGSASGAAVYRGGGFGGLGTRGGVGVGVVGHGSGRAGGGGVVGGMLGKLTANRSQTLTLFSGPLSRTRVRLALRYSYAVELCQRTGNAWATVELVIDKGAVTRSRVIASSPKSSTFQKCVRVHLGRLHFNSRPKRTVVRATLHVTRPSWRRP